MRVLISKGWVINMDVNIDIDRLRRDMMDYFGTAMFSASPLAVLDLAKVERASDMEIVEMAKRNRVDLRKYIIER